MRTSAIFIISIILFTGCGQNQIDNSNLDFASIDEFLKITSKLKKDIEPDVEAWNKLFNTPGYTILTESEFSEEYFKNYFRLAYMPGKSDQLEQELKKKHWRIEYLKHMRKVPAELEKIEAHRRQLLSSNVLTEKALELTKEYLPENFTIGNQLLPISFVVFGNDARGYSNIIIDILYSIEQGENLKYLVGHEAHHFYRNMMLKFSFPEETSPDYNLIWVLNQIQSEGIADQIDKKVRYFKGGELENNKWALIYKKHLKNTPDLIEKMDSLLTYGSDNQDSLSIVGEELRNIVPMSGHPTGYFMTEVIIGELGKTELLESLADPFEFFRLYNRAAEKAEVKYPVFSLKAVDLINSLNKKHGI